MITHIQITNNIDLVWEIVNEHLESICDTKGVPVICCVHDTVFPKYHRVDPAIYYISIDEELVARCAMILASYSVPRDEATSYDIHVRDCTAVYHMDKNIFSVIFPISSAGSICWCMPSVLSRRVTDGLRITDLESLVWEERIGKP